MLFHQVFRQGKLEANRKQNYIYKTKFHCSPRTENQIISVKPSFTVRPARRMPLVLLEGCRSSCSKSVARLARRVSLALLGAYRSSCSEGAVPKVIMYASTIKSEKYFRNVRDKSRPGIGVYFVEYGVNFRLRKCHYCKSRF